jgi:GNAT superfamily N-acetyltransferase
MSEHLSKSGAKFLFDPALVSSSIKASLPSNIVVRMSLLFPFPSLVLRCNLCRAEGRISDDGCDGCKFSQARPLARDDYLHGHIELLSTLTSAPLLTAEVYEARFDAMLARPLTYFVVVFEDVENDGKIVASASVFVELKFLRNAGLVGHIEDVVVHPDCKGKSMGKIMLNALTELAIGQGCYKVILDCDPKNTGESTYLWTCQSRRCRRADRVLSYRVL